MKMMQSRSFVAFMCITLIFLSVYCTLSDAKPTKVQSGSSSKPQPKVGSSAKAPMTKSKLVADRQSKVSKLLALGSDEKVRDAHTQFDNSIDKAKATLRAIQVFEAGVQGVDQLNVQPGKELNAIRYVQRARAKVALLNARFGTVKNPQPFSATSSIAMRSPAQFKKMISTRRPSKGIKIPIRRLGQPPVAPATAANGSEKAQSKVSALKEKVAAASSSSETPKRKSRSLKRSLVQIRSKARQAPTGHSGSGGVVRKSGKVGGASGSDSRESGGGSSKSGKIGGIPDAKKSGKIGGNSGGSTSPTNGFRVATAEENAKCNPVTPGAITVFSAKAAGIKLYKNTPGYKKLPGDIVLADGRISTQSPEPVPMQFNPRTGKCFAPLVTYGKPGVVYPGICKVCPERTNPAISPYSQKPWEPTDIHYDINDQICYGPRCPPNADEMGVLELPFRPMGQNGRLFSNDYPYYSLKGQIVNAYQRNQGDGSWCWANTAVMLLEIAQQLFQKDAQGNNLPQIFKSPLSVATVVNCVPNKGKDGGSPIDALEWMKTHVVPTNSNLRIGEVVCPPAVPRGQGSVKSYILPIPTCDTGDCSGQTKYEEELAEQAKIMPILVYVDASQWLTYKPVEMSANGGKWDMNVLKFPSAACSNNPDLGNHVVILTGTFFDKKTNKRYWSALNSWGSHWGTNLDGSSGKSSTKGFIFLDFGVNACGLANFPVAVDQV